MEKAPYTADTPMIIVETGMIQKFKALLDIQMYLTEAHMFQGTDGFKKRQSLY